jgi:ATP-dependent Zn protease
VSDLARETARHEAGHAVVGFVLGHQIGLVSIRAHRAFVEVKPPERPSLQATVEACLVHLAGEAAEYLLLPSSGYVHADVDELAAERVAVEALSLDDRAFVQGYSAELTSSDEDKVSNALAGVEEATLFLAWVRARCRRLVATHARAIETVAAALLERPVMDGATAETVIREALRSPERPRGRLPLSERALRSVGTSPVKGA